MSLLEAEPGSNVKVKKKHTGEVEDAIAHPDGTVRDEEGRSYSSGAYEIVEVEPVD